MSLKDRPQVDENYEPIFKTILGAEFEELPIQVRELHGSGPKRVYKGKSRISRGKGVIANIVGFVVGFPSASDNANVMVSISSQNGVERWVRNFDGKQFHSTLRLGTGRNKGFIIEQFGLVSVGMKFTLKDNKLYFLTRRWFFLGSRYQSF